MLVHREKDQHGTRWIVEKWILNYIDRTFESYEACILIRPQIAKMKLMRTIKRADEAKAAFLISKGMLDILREFDLDTPADIETLT